MSSIWPHSNAVEFTSNGVPAAGALAYFFLGGTTTPLVVYSDANEATPITSPVTADANGRWPNVFIPYTTTYDVRVTTAAGTQLYYPQNIPNPNPATAATGTIVTSSAQLFQTGGMRFEVAIGSAPSGWVRGNGLTIGSATSGATERANADTSALYTYLWNAAPNGVLPVSTGRGASAAADFAANKTLTLPDLRGGFPIGADTMGNSAAGRFATATFTTGDSITGASRAGSNVHSLTTAQLAPHSHGTGTLALATESAHTHGGTTSGVSANHTHAISTGTAAATVSGVQAIAPNTGGGATSVVAGAGVNVYATNQFANLAVALSGSTDLQSQDHTHTLTTNSNSGHTHAISGSTASAGLGDYHNNLSICTLGTWLIKL